MKRSGYDRGLAALNAMSPVLAELIRAVQVAPVGLLSQMCEYRAPNFRSWRPFASGMNHENVLSIECPSLDRVVHRAVRLDVEASRSRGSAPTLTMLAPASVGARHAARVFRLQRAPRRIGVHRVFEHETIPDRVDLRVRQDRRQRADQRLIEVGLVAVARQRFLAAVEPVELRRALAQPAERPRVLVLN